MSAIVEQYRAPAWWPMRRVASADTGGGRQVFAAWLTLSLGAVALSILEARHGWGAIVAIGNLGVPVVLYPPLAVTLLIVFWLGPEWGIIPAYAATLARALTIGMPSGAAALFAELRFVLGDVNSLGARNSAGAVRWRASRYSRHCSKRSAVSAPIAHSNWLRDTSFAQRRKAGACKSQADTAGLFEGSRFRPHAWGLASLPSIDSRTVLCQQRARR